MYKKLTGKLDEDGSEKLKSSTKMCGISFRESDESLKVSEEEVLYNDRNFTSER